MCTPGFIRFYIRALFIRHRENCMQCHSVYFETITCCTQMRKFFFWSYKIHVCFLCSSRHCDSQTILDVSLASLTLQYMDIINIFFHRKIARTNCQEWHFIVMVSLLLSLFPCDKVYRIHLNVLRIWWWRKVERKNKNISNIIRFHCNFRKKTSFRPKFSYAHLISLDVDIFFLLIFHRNDKKIHLQNGMYLN